MAYGGVAPVPAAVAAAQERKRARFNPTLKDRAEQVVMKHRAKCPNAVTFRAIQQRRREIGLDDWSGDIQMVLEALEGLERYHAEKEQLRLPETH
jgi:hypothetical protein